MIKLPYDYITKEVDKLYDREIDPNDLEAVSRQCEFIQTFIESCGWTTEDYIDVMIGVKSEQKAILN